MLELLKKSSTLPPIAKEYLEAIIETNDELIDFLINYYPKHQNVMVAIAEYRVDKFKRRTFSFFKFVKMYDQNPFEAISKLFLYPIRHSLYERYVITPIDNGTFALNDLYYVQKTNPILNPTLLAKHLLLKN